MCDDVGLRTFPVKDYAKSFYLVEVTGVVKFAMMVNARLVGKKASISAYVEKFKWKEIVLRRFLGVIIRVKSCSVVKGMYVPEGVMRVSVGIVHSRGRGLALVGRECMKGWLVMLLFHCVGELVINC